MKKHATVVLILLLANTQLQPAVRAESIQQVKVSNSGCVAVGSDINITCNDLRQIRKALQPELRRQFDRILPSLTAQRTVLDSLLRHRFDLLRKSLQIDLKQTVEDALAQHELQKPLQEWIERAQQLEAELTGPDTAPALAALREGNFDAAERALQSLRPQQDDAIAQLKAAAAAARHAAEAAENALLEQEVKVAETEVALSTIAYLRVDYATASRHLRAAVRIYRILRGSGTNADELDDKRAAALLTLSHIYRLLERRDEAVKAAQVATGIYRTLASSNPAMYEPKLAQGLTTLANVLSTVGSYNQSIQYARSAAKLYVRLVEERPDEFLPKYASLLCDLGGVLTAVSGRYEEAILLLQVAADIQRKLLAEKRDFPRMSLTTTLANLASAYHHSYRGGQAVAAMEEATHLFEELARGAPAVYSRELAMARNNLANIYLAEGRTSDSVNTIEQALHWCQSSADCSAPRLGLVLDSAGRIFSHANRPGDALRAGLESVRTRRGLLDAHPSNMAFQRDLASSLSRLARHQKLLGQDKQALATIQEAVNLQTQLVERLGLFKNELDDSVAFLDALTGSIAH
jgi:tetratricopeptide (TPR) repeat protein